MLAQKKRKFYAFSAGELMAKAAESTEELIAEGDALHHCVGTYADKHAKGKCTIILLRRKNEPDKPYYTMELDPRNAVLQVRGDHNRGMTEEVKTFVEAYKAYLATLSKKIKEAKAA